MDTFEYQPETREFRTSVCAAIAEGTVTFFRPQDPKDSLCVYTVDAYVKGAHYKFSIVRTGHHQMWRTSTVSLMEDNRLVSMYALALSSPRVDSLFEMALIEISKFKYKETAHAS